MSKRINYANFSPKSMQKLMELSMVTKEGTLGRTIIDLINIRASQLNHCAFCLDMHSKEAKIHGEKELRLYHIPVWKESPLFSDKEKLALEFTEALTKLNDPISDDLYNRVREQFNDQEVVEMSYLVGVINLWNRMNAVFQSVPGSLDKMFGLDKAGL